MAEVAKLIDQEIPEGRQHLQESYTNLDKVAQYCRENYLKVERFNCIVTSSVSIQNIFISLLIKVLNIVLVWNKFMIYPLLLALLTNKVSSELLIALLCRVGKMPAFMSIFHAGGIYW